MTHQTIHKICTIIPGLPELIYTEETILGACFAVRQIVHQ